MKEPKTLLQQLIRARGMTYIDALEALAAEARRQRIEFRLSLRQFSRWVAGDVVDHPQPATAAIAERIFGRDIEALLGPPEAADDQLAVSAGSTRSDRPSRRVGVNTESDWVAVTAHEAGDHATDHGSFSIPETTIEQLHDDVVELARVYADTPPLALHIEAVRVRDRVYGLLERTRRPAQTAELYLLAGQLGGILGSASFDLGYWPAAVEHCRAAFTYGELLDHHPLRAWARGVHAQVAWRSGRPQAALDLIHSAQQYAAPGTATLRLKSFEARAWAHLGAPVETVRAVEASEAELEHVDGSDELSDQVGGEFAFGRARQAMCNGTALLQVRQADAAIAQAQHVIDLGTASGAGPSDPVVVCARADLALARLLGRDFDGAAEAVAPVFAVPPDQRRRGLMERLTTVRQALASQHWRALPAARELAAKIEDFATAEASRGLPEAMGRPIQ